MYFWRMVFEYLQLKFLVRNSPFCMFDDYLMCKASCSDAPLSYEVGMQTIRCKG